MKYIVGLLFVITIMHDVRIYRLNRNVEVLTAFFDEAVRRLKEFEDKHLEQTDCPWK